MMMVSREAVVNYMTPLGLAHIMAHGPPLRSGAVGHGCRAPTGRRSTITARTRSASASIARRRGATRSRSTSPPVRDRYADRATVPDSLLLWFHHVGWTDTDAVRPHAVGRARAALSGGRRHRARDAARRGARCAARSTTSASQKSQIVSRDPGAGSAVVARRRAPVLPDVLAPAASDRRTSRRRTRSQLLHGASAVRADRAQAALRRRR